MGRRAKEPPYEAHTGRATATSLALPFPLRTDFLAQVVVPRDMTKDEAKRLGAFLEALANETPTPELK